MYSSSIIFVLTIGNGVYSFTLDHMYGEFVQTQEKIQIPKEGKIYAFNEGNYQLWDDKLKKYIYDLKDPRREAIFHQVHWESGWKFPQDFVLWRYLRYPRDKKSMNGKLRLLYECTPKSFIVEQASGKGSDGYQRILDIDPVEIHQQVPLYIGALRK